MRKEFSTFATLVLIFVVAQLCATPAMAQANTTIFGDVRIVGDHNEVVSREVTLILRRVPDGRFRARRRGPILPAS